MEKNWDMSWRGPRPSLIMAAVFVCTCKNFFAIATWVCKHGWNNFVALLIWNDRLRPSASITFLRCLRHEDRKMLLAMKRHFSMMHSICVDGYIIPEMLKSEKTVCVPYTSFQFLSHFESNCHCLFIGSFVSAIRKAVAWHSSWWCVCVHASALLSLITYFHW